MILDWSVDALVARGEVDPTWADALQPVEPALIELGENLSGVPFLPAADAVFRALTLPLPDVRVVILGQDPYPTPGHATGLAFSVACDVAPIPRSLRNVFDELHRDLGLARPMTGDLSSWLASGVLLLNRSLTVAPGEPGSHDALGWDRVTDAVLDALVQRDDALVVLAWGRAAAVSTQRFDGHPRTRRLESAHPSPLSASRGFVGSRPFSQANQALRELGSEPIDWLLP